MKSRSVQSLVVSLAILNLGLLGSAAGKVVTPSKSHRSQPPLVKSNAIPRSVFIVPKSPKQGRDPFFPNSNRLFQSNTPHQRYIPHVALIYNGLSGTAHNKLAIINGHTFAEGETAEVRTSSGRVRVHCLQINGATVTVEVGGQRRQLRFHSGS